jgi:hypothetical protein
LVRHVTADFTVDDVSRPPQSAIAADALDSLQ